VSKPTFVVPLADLEWGPKSVSFELSEAWLRHALEDSEATTRGPGRLDVELIKNGKDVIVRGRVRCELSMPCVVTLDPVEVNVNAEVFLMLAPAKPSAGTPSPRKTKAPRKKAGGAKAEGGRAEGGWARDPELSDDSVAHDTYEGSEVALDPFVREFILLELPLFPKRSDLPLDQMPAIPPAAAEPAEAPIDPRLAPLAKLKARLSQK
jgi:DUF177 domain-containing protein